MAEVIFKVIGRRFLNRIVCEHPFEPDQPTLDFFFEYVEIASPDEYLTQQVVES